MLKKLRLGKEKANARKLQRYRVDSECQIETGSGTFPGLLTDLSPIGARVETDASVEIDEQVTIMRADGSTVTGHVVRTEEGAVALKFEMNAESVSYAFKALTEPMLNAANKAPVQGGSAVDGEPEVEAGPEAAASSEGGSEIEDSDA